MLLYLAGVNEHAGLRIVGSKRWSVAHFLRTIQYLFEYGVRDGLRRRKARNCFLFAVLNRPISLDRMSEVRPGVVLDSE